MSLAVPCGDPRVYEDPTSLPTTISKMEYSPQHLLLAMAWIAGAPQGSFQMKCVSFLRSSQFLLLLNTPKGCLHTTPPVIERTPTLEFKRQELEFQVYHLHIV